MSWDGPVALGQPLQVLVLRVNWNYHNLNTGLLCESDKSPPALGPRSSPWTGRVSLWSSTFLEVMRRGAHALGTGWSG